MRGWLPRSQLQCARRPGGLPPERVHLLGGGARADACPSESSRRPLPTVCAPIAGAAPGVARTNGISRSCNHRAGPRWYSCNGAGRRHPRAMVASSLAPIPHRALDQRACGRAARTLRLIENTTWDLVADIDAMTKAPRYQPVAGVRRALGLDPWALAMRSATRGE